MGSTTEVYLPHNVAPGERIDLSVNLTAPMTVGHHRGYWMLRNPTGGRFGYGDSTSKAFYVDIFTADSSSSGVSGKICYPSERIPPMTLYLQNMDNNKLSEVLISEDQETYTLPLSPGTYLACAWTNLDISLGGGYTDVDHNLKPFQIKSGKTTTGIDICDWYGEQGKIPPPDSSKFGIISGSLSFPSEHIPALRIVAFDIYNGTYYWVDTVENQQSYQIKKLFPGYYTVVAYPLTGGDLAGGYANDAHVLITVYVTPDTNSTGINPSDWYAPEGTFPRDPTR